MGIEPGLLHEEIPLMQEGKTQMHFKFRSMIEVKMPIKYSIICFVF